MISSFRFLPLILVLTFQHVGTSAVNTWSWRNPLPQGNTLVAVTYGRGLFVAGGISHQTLHSPDGESWDFGRAQGLRSTRHLAFGNGLFVAAGHGMHDYMSAISVSGDGINWTAPIETSRYIESISFREGRFFISTVQGDILTSEDGFAWSEVRHGSNILVSNIEFGLPGFVAIKWPATPLISSDGKIWVPASPFDHDGVRAIRYDGKRFVAVGNRSGAGHSISTSEDATTWQQSAFKTDVNLYDITIGSGVFVAVGDRGTIVTSPDGLNWTSRESGTTGDLYAIHFANDRFVVVSGGGMILVSTNGLTWKKQRRGGKAELRGVAVGESGPVAVGRRLLDHRGIVFIPAGSNGWTEAFSGEFAPLNAVVDAQGKYLAVGDRGWILQSADRIRWEQVVSQETNNLRSVCYGAAKWAAVGDNGTVLTSLNATQWIKQILPGGPVTLRGVAYGADRFVAVGFRLNAALSPSAAVFSSADGISWAESSLPRPIRLSGVTFGSHGFVVVGEDGTIAYSTDSLSWAPAPFGGGRGHQSVAYGNGVYVAVGFGSIVWSANGEHWSKNLNVTHDTLTSVTYGNGMFTAVGQSGTVLTASVPPAPDLTAPTVGGTDLTFQISGVPGSGYEVLANSNLSSNSWVTIQNGILERDLYTIVVTNALIDPSKYYRVKLQY